MLMRIVALGLALAAACSCTTATGVNPQPPGVVQSEFDSYIVTLADPPVIAYSGDLAGYAATKPINGEKIDPENEDVQKYQGYLMEEQLKVAEEHGVQDRLGCIYTMALNGFGAKMSHEEAQQIALHEHVIQVDPEILHQMSTDNTPAFLGLDQQKKGKGARKSSYTGEGVVVGVIDSGIWPEHPSLVDDGSYSLPPIGPLADTPENPSCNFGDTTHNPEDAPFLCNNKLIGARQMLSTYRSLYPITESEYDSARDGNNRFLHGTHIATIAAGNADVDAFIQGKYYGTVSGIAHRAHIISYKVAGPQGAFSSDITACIDQAVADGVDVINLSMNQYNAPRLPSAVEMAFLNAASAGVHVASSAGNTGRSGAATILNPTTVPWVTTVGASTHDRTFTGSASSSDGWEFFGPSLTEGTAEVSLVDAADHGDELCTPGKLEPSVAGKIVLCKRGAITRVDKSLAVLQAGGAGMILYNAENGQTQDLDLHWVPSVHISSTDGLVIKDYISSAGMDAMAQINGGVSTKQDAPSMAAFSSRGPNPVFENIIKPDITAPGVDVLAGHTPVVYDGVQGELFQVLSNGINGGTSMATPHVAGIMALMHQAHPDWSPAMVKSAIMTSAYQDVTKEDGLTPAGVFDMGAGHVDPSGDTTRKGSLFNPGLVFDAGFLEYQGFFCDGLSYYWEQGTCESLESMGVPTESINLNLPSIGVGSIMYTQTVFRTVTNPRNSTVKYYAHVEAPEGFEVIVTPDKLELEAGESATFEVDFTNVDGIVDVWKEGSLTYCCSWGKTRISCQN